MDFKFCMRKTFKNIIKSFHKFHGQFWEDIFSRTIIPSQPNHVFLKIFTQFWPMLGYHGHWVVTAIERATTTVIRDIRVTTIFYDLGLSRLGFEHPTFRMQGVFWPWDLNLGFLISILRILTPGVIGKSRDPIHNSKVRYNDKIRLCDRLKRSLIFLLSFLSCRWI